MAEQAFSVRGESLVAAAVDVAAGAQGAHQAVPAGRRNIFRLCSATDYGRETLSWNRLNLPRLLPPQRLRRCLNVDKHVTVCSNICIPSNERKNDCRALMLGPDRRIIYPSSQPPWRRECKRPRNDTAKVRDPAPPGARALLSSPFAF